MSRKPRPLRRLASARAARRRRLLHAPPERLPALAVTEATQDRAESALDDEGRPEPCFEWEPD